MSQDAPTFCIQVPTLEATEAIQSQRKTDMASGPHAEVVTSAPFSKFAVLGSRCLAPVVG
jgi:hypothetical protein